MANGKGARSKMARAVENTPSDELPKTFGLWSGLSIGWNTMNVFSGMSFILFVDLSAGGMPTVLYGLYVIILSQKLR